MTSPDDIARAAADRMWAADTASRQLGMTLDEVRPGYARLAMTITPSMVQGHGNTHGGMIFTLADSAFAFACNSYGPTTVAAHCDVSFLRPAGEGDRLVAEAVERERYGRNGIYDVTVRRESDGVIVAEFRGRSRTLNEAGAAAPSDAAQPILIKGQPVAEHILADVATRATAITAQRGAPPRLATVLVGDDPSSHTYVAMKRRRAARAAIEADLHQLAADVTTDVVVDLVRSLSADPAVDGILVQHPVPPQVDETAVFEAIAPSKDVDGVTTASFAAMSFGRPGFASATPGAIMRLLDAYAIDPSGMRAVVVGRSPILGKPVAALLLQRNATVTIAHSRTRDLGAVLRDADLVVAAVGRPELIRGEQLKRGVVVIDAGYNPGNVGDVHFASASAVASAITPVPGGVGPVTIATLLEQTVQAAEGAPRRAV